MNKINSINKMKIMVSYELGGVENNCILSEIMLDCNTQSCEFTREDLLSHLKSSSTIEINEDSILSYYNSQKCAYQTLKPKEIFSYSDSDPLKILIRKPTFPTVSSLLQKINELEKKIKSLTSEVQETDKPSFKTKKQKTLSFQYSEIDIAMLHGAPLVMGREEECFPIEDSSLDFQAERRKLTGYLTDNDIGAFIRFEAATTENFADILEYKPKIIYISCQGYLKQSPQEFVLAFEQPIEVSDNKSEIGQIQDMTSETLQTILNNAPQYFQIVIIKGIYSQEMAYVFRNAGFNCVLAVQDLKDNTKTDEFIADFCKNLLKGDTIIKAKEKAESKHPDEKGFLCCCAHRHKSTCKWVKSLTLSNTQKKHNEHALGNCCKSPGGFHKSSCIAASDFYMKYSENLDSSSELVLEQHIKVCCCANDLDHSKLKKYDLLYSDESVLDQVLFEGPIRSNIEYICPLPAHLKPPYIEKFTTGRRMEIREVIGMSLTSRGVNVFGFCGMGKTTLLKRAAQYLYERRVFKDGVVYLDFFTKTDIIFLYRYISNILNLSSFTTKGLGDVLSNLDILLILDNIDPLLEQDTKIFIDTFNYLITNTAKPRFIVASRTPILELVETKAYEIPLISIKQAKRLISHYSKDNNHKRNYSDSIGSLNPSDIIQDTLLPKFAKPDQQGESDDPLGRSLQWSIKTLPKTEEFLKIIYCLPSGAHDINYKTLCQEFQINHVEMLAKCKKDPGDKLGSGYIHSESNDEFIYLKNEVANYIKSQWKVDIIYTQAIIHHLAVFSRGILKAALSKRYNFGSEYRSSLIFANAALENGIWGPLYPQSTEIAKLIYDPLTIFNKIQGNFWYYINANNSKELSEDTKNSLGEIMICTASIFTMFGRFPEAHAFIDRGRDCCTVFKMHKYLSLLQITQASIYSFHKDYAKALVFIEEALKSHIFDIKAESLLLFALSKHKSQVNISHIQKAVDAMTEYGIKLGAARAHLSLIWHSIDQKLFNDSFLPLLDEALQIFQSTGHVYLRIKAILCKADWHFEAKRVVQSREVLNDAVMLVKETRNSKLENEVSARSHKINEFILRTKQNCISLLKAFPLVEKLGNEMITRAGPICRFSSSFRNDLHSALQSTSKEICLVMDIASREKFKKCLNEKTIILHFASEMCSSDKLYFEKENGVADPVSLLELKDLCGGNFSQYGVKLLVLAVPFSVKIGQYFKDQLGVKHVVCFNFLSYPKDGDPVLIYLTFESCIHHFCIEFYKNLVLENTVREAFEIAKESMKDLMSKKVEEFEFLEIRGENFKKWWEEFHKNEPILVNEYSSEHDVKLFTSFDTQDKCLIEMSSMRGPCNIKKELADFKTTVGRQVEMYNVITSLADSRCVHIFGVEGIGKTEFVSQVGYYLNVRNLYPDGIYVLNLYKKSSLDEVYSTFKEEGLTSHSTDIDPRVFLSNRKMLLILENCDSLYTGAVHTFNSLLGLFINECGISLILTTSIHIRIQEGIEMRRFALRHLSNTEGYMLLCLTSPEYTSQNLEDENEKRHFNRSIGEILKDSQSLPKKIKNWAPRLKKQRPSQLLAMLAFRKFQGPAYRISDIDTPDLLPPELMLKRSNTVNAQEQIEDIPRLSRGVSNYERFAHARDKEE